MSVHNYYSHTILDPLRSPHALIVFLAAILTIWLSHRPFNCSATPYNHIRLTSNAL